MATPSSHSYARVSLRGAVILRWSSCSAVSRSETRADPDTDCVSAAWLYVRKDLIDKFAPRVTGWFGNEAPFAFTMPDQSYAEGIWRYMGGTPAIAALYQARAGQSLIAEIGVRRIRDKSLAMTQKCIDWVDELGLTLNSPRPAETRGGSVVFDFVGAADVCRELNRRKYFCDHRPTAGIRIAPHYYTKPEEIALFFNELKKIRGGGVR